MHLPHTLTNRKIQIVTGVVILALIGGMAAVIVLHGHKKTVIATTSTHKTTTQKETASTTPDYSNAQLFQIGDTVQFASQNLKVNSARVATSISSQYSSPQFADPGTKFVIVNMTVTNTTSETFTYRNFVLIDQKDRLYSDAYANTIGNIDNYLEGSDLPPSVPVTGNEIYEVPQDSTAFRLGGAYGSTEKLLLVQFQP